MGISERIFSFILQKIAVFILFRSFVVNQGRTSIELLKAIFLVKKRIIMKNIKYRHKLINDFHTGDSQKYNLNVSFLNSPHTPFNSNYKLDPIAPSPDNVFHFMGYINA